MNTNQVKGRIKAVQGKAKEVTGQVIGDKTLERPDKREHAGGKGQGL